MQNLSWLQKQLLRKSKVSERRIIQVVFSTVLGVIISVVTVSMCVFVCVPVLCLCSLSGRFSQ